MQTARRRRTTWAIAASLVAHVAVLWIVAVQMPTLTIPVEPGGPPQSVIPVLLMPRTPPPAAGQRARPQPIRLHRRPQRFTPPQVEPAPIAPPSPPAQAPPAPRAPVVLHPAPLPEGPKGDVRAALRHGPVGCANPAAVGLNKAERELCDEALGKGVRTATPFATGTELTADKRRMLDAAAAQREADYNYKRQPPIPPPNAGSAPTAGATAEDMCKGLGIPPEKCGVHSH
jgi:hypothetical protein